MSVAKYFLLLALAVACGGNNDTRSLKRYQGDGYSVAKPGDGWTMSHERGDVMFIGSGARSKHTILLRSAARPALLAENTPSSVDNVAAATRRALEALPGVNFERCVGIVLRLFSNENLCRIR